MYNLLYKHVDRETKIFVITTDQKIHVIEENIKLSLNITNISTEKLIKTFFLSICLFSYHLNFLHNVEKNISIDKKLSDSLRRKVKESNDFTCQICKEKFTGSSQQKLTVHHIKPRSLGGRNIFQNLIPLCQTCHSRLHELMDYILSSFKKEQYNRSNITELFKKFVSIIESYCKYFFEKIKYKKFFPKNIITI